MKSEERDLEETWDFDRLWHCDGERRQYTVWFWFWHCHKKTNKKNNYSERLCTGEWTKAGHTSPQASINLENSPREVTYVFRRLRGHTKRPHCQSNQISPSFGDFWPKSWKTLRHVSGHVTRATWVLKVQCESPRVVPSDRLWNFSICSKDTGVIWPYLWRNYIWKKPCFTFSL